MKQVALICLILSAVACTNKKYSSDSYSYDSSDYSSVEESKMLFVKLSALVQMLTPLALS